MSSKDTLKYRREYYRKNKLLIKEINNRYCENNKDKIADKAKIYYEKNKKRILKRVKTYYKKNLVLIRNRDFQNRFDITLKQYNYLSKKQKRKCAICLKKSSKRLSVDHDHITKKVRGLLCTKCNFAVGLFGDNIRILNRAIRYLRKGTK